MGHSQAQTQHLWEVEESTTFYTTACEKLDAVLDFTLQITSEKLPHIEI